MALRQEDNKAIVYAKKMIERKYGKEGSGNVVKIMNMYLKYLNAALLNGYPCTINEHDIQLKMFLITDLDKPDILTPKSGYSIKLMEKSYLTFLADIDWANKNEYIYRPIYETKRKLNKILNSENIFKLKGNDSTNKYKTSYY